MTVKCIPRKCTSSIKKNKPIQPTQPFPKTFETQVENK